MMFRGRTVLTFLLLGMFASSLLTLTIVKPFNPGETAAASGAIAASASPTEGLSQEDLDKISTVYQLIQSRYLEQVEHDTLMNGAIHGMIDALGDPFTSYMDAGEAQQFADTINSSFQGIGAEVTLQSGKVTIVTPIKDSPAEKAGLRANDVILSVNGEELDGLTLNQAVMKIRGPKGTQAKLGILRGSASEAIEVIVVRDDIPIETVFSEVIEGTTIGKIELRHFSTTTASRFKEELDDLLAQGVESLIIDVRNNPGGLLPAVVDIAENFIARGKPILQIEDRQGERVPTMSDASAAPQQLPIVVLINQGSASASEILAGALKDSGLATLVGQPTYGKGTVQVTFEKEMGDGSNIKLTSYKWLTPNGVWVHEEGIAPDIAVERSAYYDVLPFSKRETLKLDMNVADVQTLQLMLEAMGYAPGRSDGYFSQDTETALKQYQQDTGLPVTGEADEDVMDSLQDDVVAKLRNPDNDRQLKEAIKQLQQ